MHIAIVRTEFAASRGGAERYAVALAHAWLEDGHRVSIVCARHDPADAQGMEIHTVSRPSILGPFKHRWFASRAGESAKATGADAVLCLARAWPGDMLRLGDGLHRAWLGARYPDLGQRRRALLNPRHRELLRLEQQMFLPGRFGLYVANSDMIRRAVTHMYGVDSSRVLVVPNGVDPAKFHTGVRNRCSTWRAEHGIAPDAQVLLFSGMDFRRKGLFEAARGFRELARIAPLPARLRFVCVGRGDAGPARELLRQAGLEAQTLFMEATDAIENWYGAADLFVLPTMHDPSANAVTEALACGLPVITSSENGARQHILTGKNGHVLRDRADASAMARAMLDWLARGAAPQDVATLSRLGTQRENAQQMLRALQQAMALRGARAHTSKIIRGESRSAKLRALKAKMWAEGDARDYRQVFREMEDA